LDISKNTNKYKRTEEKGASKGHHTLKESMMMNIGKEQLNQFFTPINEHKQQRKEPAKVNDLISKLKEFSPSRLKKQVSERYEL
jgi:flagellar biosynthesis protein FliP